MNNDKKKYKRLCSSIPNAVIGGGKQTIMINDDHILVVLRKGMSEEYRRFFLKDICRMTVYKTWWRRVSLVITVLILAILLLPTILLYYSRDRSASYFFAVFALMAFCFLMMDIFRGPTGKVVVTTINSEDSLTFTNRFYATLAVLRKIRPMIEAAQGGITRNETVERLIAENAKRTERESGESPSSENSDEIAGNSVEN